MNLADFLLEGKEPSRIALRFLHEDRSYGDLQTATDEIARYLVNIGCKKGDRAALVSRNSFFWIAAYIGILRAGLVCVPLSISVSMEDLDHILKTTEARVAFLQTEFAARNRPHLTDLHVMTDCRTMDMPNTRSHSSFHEWDIEPQRGPSVHVAVDPGDLAALMFTSGSTGRPRGVMVSHRNIIANTKSIIQYLGLTENDRIMTVLPFHYCFGTSLLHTHLRVGGSLVVDLRFMYPDAVLQRMQETACTGFAGVPSHFQILLRNSSLRKTTLPHLRYVQQAGGHLAPRFIHELQEALPNTQVFVMYGQTEATARLSYLPPECLHNKLGSIGKGIPGVALRVVDEAGQEVEPGDVGEIVAEGENVTQGYWRAPEETASAFRNGRLYTGDMATVDKDGFIYVVDRAKEFLKCGGTRVSCKQIEDRLLECEELLEAAVVGVPDEVLGEAVKAFVVARTGSSNGLSDNLLLFCKKNMPPHLVPREIVLLDALPKNSSGKVLKQNLRIL